MFIKQECISLYGEKISVEVLMYRMTLEETMLTAKIFAYAIGDINISLNQLDKDSAVSMLKRMADQRWDWTEGQKKQFKDLVDTCKQLM